MKRKTAAVLVILCALILCGFCLKHEPVLAAGTEPKTSASGVETEGEPHDHDWEDATFANPRRCRICGETEGTALGSSLFVRALNPELPEDTRFAFPSVTSEKPDTDILISGNVDGFGDADDIISNSRIKLTVKQGDEQRIDFRIEADINGSGPVYAVGSAGMEELCLSMPEYSDKVYSISYQDLLDILTSALEESGVSFDYSNRMTAKERMSAIVSEEDAKAMLIRYEEILFSVADEHNTTERIGTYTLQGLQAEENCVIIRIAPDAADWRMVLHSLFSTAKNDKQLNSLIEESIRTYSSSAGNLGSSADYSESIIASLPQLYDQLLDNVDNMAEMLSLATFEIAYRDGRMYALKVTALNDAYSYESFGDPDIGRSDALVYTKGDSVKVIAHNHLISQNGKTSGHFGIDEKNIALSYVIGDSASGDCSFDARFILPGTMFRASLKKDGTDDVFDFAFDLSDESGSLTVRKTAEGSSVEIPDTEKTVLTTQDDLASAGMEIMDNLYQAELFGHNWLPATCTEPETCSICGETQGEALGHDWMDATVDAPKTCSRCGLTEGEPLPAPQKNALPGRAADNTGKYSVTVTEYLARMMELINSGFFSELYPMQELTCNGPDENGYYYLADGDLLYILFFNEQQAVVSGASEFDAVLVYVSDDSFSESDRRAFINICSAMIYLADDTVQTSRETYAVMQQILDSGTESDGETTAAYISKGNFGYWMMEFLEESGSSIAFQIFEE